MAGRRFELIGSQLHMSDPAKDAINDELKGKEGYDPLFRLKPLQDQILTACRAYYHPHKNLSIGERMVATKGRIGIKQYTKNKPTNWGFKLFVLADSKSGYTCEFSVYQGKPLHSLRHGLAYDAVVNLLHVPSLGTGFHLYVDKFYTSTALFRHLHKIQFGVCGTVKSSRDCFPKTTVNALPNRAERGDMRWIRDGPLVYVKWRDSKDVCICSSIHKAYSGQTIQRRVKAPDGTWPIQSIPVPDPVVEYNKYMGGVDMSDAMIRCYNVNQKTYRWYKKMFLHFVDIAVVNSFIIHKEISLEKGRRPMTQKQFRESLCLQLADVGKPDCVMQELIENMIQETVARCPTPVPEVMEPPSEEAKPQFSCFPVTIKDVSTVENRYRTSVGRRKCVHCSLKTIYKCHSCNVPLCIVVDRICFTEWHNLRGSQALSKK